MRRRPWLDKPPIGALLNPGHPLSHGLIVQWLLNEGGGQRVHDLTQRYPGTLTNMDPAMDWVSTGKGLALDLDGSDDYLTGVPIDSHFAAQCATFVICLRLRSHTSGSSVGAWHLNQSDSSNHYPYADGNIYDGTFRTNRQTIGAGIISDRRQWHQVAITRDPGAWTFWQNGRIAYTVAAGSFDIDSTNFLVGRSNVGSGYYIDGQVSDIRIYNRALTQSELLWLIEQPYANIVIPRSVSYFTVAAGPITPTSIDSEEAFGSPSLSTVVFPTSIPSAEAFGTPTLVDLNVRPTSIASLESFGTPTLADFNVRVTGIPSAEAFGIPLLEDFNVRPLYGIASAEAFGTPALLGEDEQSVLFINNKSFRWVESTFRIVKSLGRPPQATCDFIYRGVNRPLYGQKVQLFWKGVLRFGGTVLEVSETNIPGNYDKSRMTLTFTGFESVLDDDIVAKKYTLFLGGLPGIIVYDFWYTKLRPRGITYRGGTIGPSIVVGEVTFHYRTLRECLNQIIDKTPGWSYWIDDYEEFHYEVPGTITAPFSIADGDGRMDKLTVISTGQKKRNRVWTVPSKDLGGYFLDHAVQADANNVVFITTYNQDEKPRVKVNGVEKRVTELFAQETGWEFYYIQGGIGVFARTPPSVGADIDILYPNPFPLGFMRENTFDIAAYGLKEFAIHAKNAETVEDCEALSQGVVDLFSTNPATVPKRVNYQYNEAHEPEWVTPGMSISLARTYPDISGVLVVESVSSAEQADTTWRHDVVLRDQAGEVTEARFIDNFQVASRGVINSKVIPATVELDINGFGLSVGVMPDRYVCQNSGFVDNWDILMNVETPLGSDIVIDALLNGTSVFASLDDMIRCPAGVGVLVSGRKFNQTNIRVQKGDIFHFDIKQIGSSRSGRYGVLHINIKV